MKQLIQNFSGQLTEALSIGKKAKLKLGSGTYEHVVVSGLGGSGIGGSIVQEFVSNQIRIPFIVNKDYFIPRFVSDKTLFIACSYSGNTEETLNAVKLAKKTGACIVCVCSGGELAAFARLHGLMLIEIPSGMPPRACLGYSLVQLLYILKYAKLIPASFESQVLKGIDRIENESRQIKQKAATLAGKLHGKFVAIYATAGHEGLAIRFRQQLNENSKILSWSNVIPEMTHNELVGWRAKNEPVAVVFCYHADDYHRNIERMKFLKKVVRTYSQQAYDLVIEGSSYWEKAIYFIHLTDWVSVFLSELNAQDPVEVVVIDALKKQMAKK